ncbi:MAG: LEA type 2 family protein [Deltaproteobacteria bacterium]|nr:LEA type 2 family protein [Deltaproteobacteria bacterium]
MIPPRSPVWAHARPLLLAFGVVSLSLFSSAGCFRKWVKFRTLQIKTIEVKAVNDASFRLDTRCELENPNALGATVTAVRFVAKTGNAIIGRGVLPGPINVPSKKRFDLVAPLVIRYADLPADFPQRVAGGLLPLTIETHFTATTSLGKYTMDLVSTGKPQIAKALEVAIHGSFRGRSLIIETYTLRKIGLRGVTLDLHVKAQNLFAFPIRIRRALYHVDINDKAFGDGEMKTPLPIPPQKTRRRILSVSATHGAIGNAVVALFGKTPRFRVRGTLWIDPVGGVSKIPIDLTADDSVFAD